MVEQDVIFKGKIKQKGIFDFKDFYTKNRKTIFLEIISIFEEIIELNIDNIFLDLHVSIDDLKFQPSLRYGLKDLHILKKDFLPFFEEQEEYEICKRIKNILEIKNHS